MKSIILLAILAIGGAAFFLLGPSVAMGGPTKSTIERVTRETLRATAPTPELATAAETAKLTPKGMCNKDAKVFACIVEMRVGDAAPQTFITELTKDDTGNWGAVH